MVMNFMVILPLFECCSDQSRDEGVCQECGSNNLEGSGLWVQCDNCDDWFHL